MKLGSRSRTECARLAVAGMLALCACGMSASPLPPPAAPSRGAASPLSPSASPSPVVATVRSFGASYDGVYSCTGTRLDPSGAMASVQSTMSIALDLRDSWIRGAWSDRDVDMLDYRTYDARARRWTRYLLASDGAYEALTSEGPGAGSEWTWQGMQEGPLGTLQVRHRETFEHAGIELSGDAYLGGRWTNTYRAHCRRESPGAVHR